MKLFAVFLLFCLVNQIYCRRSRSNTVEVTKKCKSGGKDTSMEKVEVEVSGSFYPTLELPDYCTHRRLDDDKCSKFCEHNCNPPFKRGVCGVWGDSQAGNCYCHT
uniref:Salivary protein FS145 n=1 Tax=Xenopsylla cheopis TaxID=163159 RepID=FS145_XENCH|nr:putative secreted salivary protein [Xenopsylla cheopis]